METFVGAVKSWVRFEFFLTMIGMIGIAIGFFSAGKYLTDGMIAIYVLLFIALFVRMGFLIGVLLSGDEAKEEDGEVEEAKCDICDNGSCWKCKKKKKLSDPV
jgi:hypothetical protein